jgi:hypothetical protein
VFGWNPSPPELVASVHGQRGQTDSCQDQDGWSQTEREIRIVRRGIQGHRPGHQVSEAQEARMEISVDEVILLLDQGPAHVVKGGHPEQSAQAQTQDQSQARFSGSGPTPCDHHQIENVSRQEGGEDKGVKVVAKDQTGVSQGTNEDIARPVQDDDLVEGP